jgi:alcohol dehydrogenase YqhD (iron-dependent ADH family)
MLNFIYFMIFLGETLLDPKARMILPLELCEKGMISLVFHVMRLFLSEYAEGTLLQSITMNSLFKKTLISTS